LRLFGRLDSLLASVPFYPFAFALYAVAQLYVINIVEVSPSDTVVSLALVFLLAAAGFAVAWLWYRDARRAAIVSTLALLLLLELGRIRLALASHGFGHGPLLLALAIAAVVLVGIAAGRASRGLSQLTQALNLVAVVLLLTAVAPMATFARDSLRVPSGLASDGLPAITVTAPTAAAVVAPRRDIYFIVLDRYGSERSLRFSHDTGSADFLDWLRDRGFVIVDGARANYVRSTLSIASALSAAPLDDIVQSVGRDNSVHAPVFDRISHSRVGEFLQRQGYEYVHLGSWYGPTRDSEIADRSLAPDDEFTFATAMFEVTALQSIIADIWPNSGFPTMHADAATYQFEQLEELIEESGPNFVFAHVLLPHDPYVFLEDGTFSPSSATFETQLAYTNTRLMELLEPLLERPESERPIIILQADEGPFPDRYDAERDEFDWASATEAEVTEKFGILTAMYLPGREGEPPLPATISPVNTFREVLGRYFGAELPYLPDRSFASTTVRPYDMIEVTDRFIDERPTS
jgi:hypothetical protein